MTDLKDRLVDAWLLDTALRYAAEHDLGQIVERYEFNEPHEYVTAHLHRTMPLIHGIGRRYFHDWNDIDDFASTVMHDALKQKHKYAGDQTPQALKNWIAGIAYLTARNIKRARSKPTHVRALTTINPDWTDNMLDMPERTQHPAIPEGERQAIHSDIDSLETPVHKTILQMRAKGHRLGEIAKHLGMTRDATAKAYNRTVTDLKGKSQKRRQDDGITERLAAIWHDVEIDRHSRQPINPKHTDKAPVDDDTISVLKDIDELSDETDKAVMRHRMQGLTSKEVATMMRMTEDNVRQRQKRVMDALRQRAILRARGAMTTSRRFSALVAEMEKDEAI